ncbi:MAG: hypothetical protein ABIM74_08495, partial [candidate division WOR-3 bacterium]
MSIPAQASHGGRQSLRSKGASSKTYEGLEHLKARNKDVLRGMIKAIFLACAFLILVGMAIEPFVSTFIPSLTSYERRYSVF